CAPVTTSMPIGSFTSNRNINATTPHATPITVCQRPPRRRPLHPGPAVVACRKSLARKESRRGLSHPRSSPHTQRIAESKRAAPVIERLNCRSTLRVHSLLLNQCGSSRLPSSLVPSRGWKRLSRHTFRLYCSRLYSLYSTPKGENGSTKSQTTWHRCID